MVNITSTHPADHIFIAIRHNELDADTVIVLPFVMTSPAIRTRWIQMAQYLGDDWSWIIVPMIELNAKGLYYHI